ncbi:t-complex 1 subunit beta [Fusarium tjaetaba]|uniref:CCT-beta n=1 Tax=Fusarium tjaetaba TaxID=1567544 RepID=A0A8H5R258_9HYPO|nr:t-complex 1 subunit beta [Fusarium tjaetaba]KAF5626681.1 t-complex 1 subunit beta [Fusarium tjaetaba]
MSFQPTQIFEEGTTEEKGENARLSAFVGAIAVGDLVKSTLGPKGMDKILQSASTAEIMVTNDGATILKSIALDNAAAKVLVNISKVQDDEVGDGTTSVAVLAAELLREAEKLVDKKIHPQTIIEGYRIASQAALKALEGSAVDHSKNPEAFRQDLLAIARTTLSSKVLAQDRKQFAELAVDAVLRLKSSDLNHIQIIKKAGGKLSDSYLDEGFILDKKIGVNQPKRLEKAKILVANTSMDTDKVKIFGARVKVGSTSKLAELEKAEKEKMKAKVEKIKAHGINCFINRQLIYNWPEQLFTDAGIMSIEHADFDGIERLALVTGGEIASTFDHPDQVKLGHCDVIEEVIIGEDTLIKFSGVAGGEACTIVLRGATEQLLDEAERSLHDALAVLSQTVKEPRTTLGGGCAEMLMAKAVEGAATRVEGKRQLAVSSFAVALRQLPTILADNAGLDSGDLVARLRKALYDGLTTYGLDLTTPGGGITDMRDLGVIESYKLKKAVVSSASEAAELLLRVDDIIRAAPRRRERMCLRSLSDIAKPMEQSKIVDFFSSSPSSQQLKQRTKKRNKSSPAKGVKGGSQSSSPNSSRAGSQQTMAKPSQKPKRQRSQASASLSRAASLHPSIPSTPISKNMSSPQIMKKRRLQGRNERVPETPPQKRAPTSSQSQQTPKRTSQLVQANSPNTPFDISSGESSDSDCVIEKVQPSPKRKLVAPSPRARPTKKLKTDQQETINRGFASIKASVLAKGTTLARQNKRPATRGPQGASVPPQAPLPNLTSSVAGPSRSTSVPPAHISPKPSQNENVTQIENESDHDNEKVELTPKKRQLEQQKANVKRRRVGDSIETPVSIDADDEDQPDSDIEVVRVLVSPRRKAAKGRATADKDIKAENSAKQPKVAAQRKTQSPSVTKRPTPTKPAVARDTTPINTLHIDLTQEPSDSSDFSDEETTIPAKPALPTPVEHTLDVQKPATTTEHTTTSNTDNPVVAPQETVPVHEQREPSPHVTDPLWDWVGRQMTKKYTSLSSSNCPSPDHDVPFTAPEYQHDDTAAKKIKMEAHDSDMISIKKESIEQYNSSDDEGSSDEESHDGDIRAIKQESSSMYGQSSDDEEDFDEEDIKNIKKESYSSPMKISALKQYESHPAKDGEKEYDDDEEESQGLPDLSDDEVSHDANTNEVEENENVGSSPPVSYQLPQEDVSPKAVSTTLEEKATFDSADKDLSNSFGSSKKNLSTPIKTEKGLSPSIYELQPVYSGEKLMQSHTPGTPSPFRPHHRDSLLGLRGILKGSGGRGRASDNESVYTPFPDISPLSGDEYATSSPTERIQQSKEQAKAIRPSERRRAIVPKAMTLPKLLPKNWTPPLPKGARWLQQKKDFTPLPSIPDDTAANDAASRQETPTKVVARRPPRINYTTGLAESEDEVEKKLQEQQLEPGTDKHWIKPSEKEIKPPIIRDGVSEHAIKPTVALFKKKIAARQGFNHDTSDKSNQKYNWEIDWTTPASLSERESQAVAAELEHRGIKTSKQYSNFWYNLTMKFSRLAGSPIPLFTAKKKALDTFVEEAMQNQEIRRRNKNKVTVAEKKAKRREMKKQKKQKTQPKDVDAFLIPGDTDAESESEDSDSDLNGANLIAKMRADAEERQRTYGGGTSCGRRSK